MNRVRVLIIIRYVGGSTAVRAFLCNTNKYKINFKGGKTDSKQRLSLLHPLIPGSLVNELTILTYPIPLSRALQIHLPYSPYLPCLTLP